MSLPFNPPPLPTRKQAGFSDLFSAFLTWFVGTFIADLNAFAASLSLTQVQDTSTTSNTLVPGIKTFTVSAGKGFVGGMYLLMADTAAPSTNSMVGQVTSYSGTTLIVNVTSSRGSGTKTAWTISQSAPGGDLATDMHAATLKATPVDADEVSYLDSTTGFSLVRATLTNWKTYWKAYFDPLYVALTGNQTIGGVKTFTSQPIFPVQSMVRVNSANGYGSTNTKIRRYTAVVSSQGSDITYADSATLGATFTVNTNGVYAISMLESANTNSNVGISLNTTQGSTNINAITTANVLGGATTGAANYGQNVSVTIYLSAGDVVRPHTDGQGAGAVFTSSFTITRVA